MSLKIYIVPLSNATATNSSILSKAIDNGLAGNES